MIGGRRKSAGDHDAHRLFLEFRDRFERSTIRPLAVSLLWMQGLRPTQGDVDDLIQEAYSRLLPKIDVFIAKEDDEARKASLLTFMQHIAQEEARNRRKQGYLPGQEQLNATADSRRRHSSLDDIVISGIRVRRTLDILAELPEEEMAIVIGVRWLEIPPKIMALELGITYGALRQRLHRITEKLRDEMQDWDNEGGTA